MKERILELLNNQIQKEFESAYAYLDLAVFFDSLSLPGFSNWYMAQAAEEEKHALRIYNYVFDSGEVVKLMPVSPLKEKPRSIIAALSTAFNQEKEVTRLIQVIYRVCEQEEDYATKNFLEWFIAEQREEETNARTMIEDFKTFGSSAEGLFILNQKLMKRKIA